MRERESGMSFKRQSTVDMYTSIVKTPPGFSKKFQWLVLILDNFISNIIWLTEKSLRHFENKDRKTGIENQCINNVKTNSNAPKVVIYF